MKAFFFAARKYVCYIKLFIVFKVENVNACNFSGAQCLSSKQHEYFMLLHILCLFVVFGTLSDGEVSTFMVLEFPSQFSSAMIEQILRRVAGYSPIG